MTLLMHTYPSFVVPLKRTQLPRLQARMHLRSRPACDLPDSHWRSQKGHVGLQEAVTTSSLLARWRGGEAAAGDHLIKQLLPDLTEIAVARLRHERDSSLSTGDLINEAVLRIMSIGKLEVANRVHLIALASKLMRNILIDRMRQKNASKRNHIKVELCTQIEGEERFDLTALNVALVRLGAIDKQYLELVEMRYFGGMTIADVAEVTGQSEPTVQRRWQVARAWLLEAIKEPIDDH